MKQLIFLFTFYILLFGDNVNDYLVKEKKPDSFITKYEYGKMLYNNPRGISCAKCHGDDAKGKEIGIFKHVIKKRVYNCVIESNDISNISFQLFKAKLDPDIKLKRPRFNSDQVCERMIYGNTMPKYFLTQDELESIHYYITNIGEK